MEKRYFGLVNVVWYDGCDAYVSKFIVQCEGFEVTEDSIKRIKQYLDGNGEVLKVDYLYDLTLDNIIAMGEIEPQTEDDAEKFASVDRFRTMYFR